VIDVQTLNPFDINQTIVGSVEKTHALVCLDEDVPGGASAFMLQQILEVQQGWWHLDAAPRTHGGDALVIDESKAVPEDVAGRRLE